jgi:hypothetical protein
LPKEIKATVWRIAAPCDKKPRRMFRPESFFQSFGGYGKAKADIARPNFPLLL